MTIVILNVHGEQSELVNMVKSQTSLKRPVKTQSKATTFERNWSLITGLCSIKMK